MNNMNVHVHFFFVLLFYFFFFSMLEKGFSTNSRYFSSMIANVLKVMGVRIYEWLGFGIEQKNVC